MSLVPVFAVYVFVRVLHGAFLENHFAVLTGLMMGIGLTAYPLFIVAILSTLIVGLLSLARAETFAARARWIVNVGQFIAASAAPALVWYLFVRLKTGGFYSHEFAQGPDVWIPAAFSQGGFGMVALKVAQYFTNMLTLASKQALPLAAFVVIAGAIALKHPRATATALRRNGAFALAALIISGGTAGFYSLAGDMHFRWAFAIIPPFMIVATVVILAVCQRLNAIERRLVASACLLIAVCQLAFTIIKDGPFS